jgi:uncharacterized protein with ParB-like and HNH nuclease domain
MSYKSVSIKKFVDKINNSSEEGGGFWLPQIQRPLVWDKEQILALFDSILRQYPFGTFLIWQTNSDMRYRSFIETFKPGLKITDFYKISDNNKKMLLLDGQQRLQSLFIGLKGSYNGAHLYFNILSGTSNSSEILKYEFDFIKTSEAKFPWIKFHDLVYTVTGPYPKGMMIINDNNITDNNQKELILNNLSIVNQCFCSNEEITYSIIDSIDYPDLYTEDDVVEIFIRANSGGTELEKSDLLFTLLVASWEDAEDKITELLEDLNRTGYNFHRDFIIKLCLVLLNTGSKYEIKKLKDENIINQIKTEWDNISNSIRFVKDFIYDKTYLKTKETLSSDLSLIPLIYFKYHFGEKWLNENDYIDYLVKVNLTGAFGGVSDMFNDGLIDIVKREQSFIKESLFSFMKEKGKSLQLTDKKLFELSYTSKKQTHLLFNIWYGFNYQPTFKGNSPQIDHIFPQSLLKSVKVVNTEGKKVSKYRKIDIDQLANIMLLTAIENGGGGKSDTPPNEYFPLMITKDANFLEKHCIPADPNLWHETNFNLFIDERKKLILNKFRNIGLINIIE